MATIGIDASRIAWARRTGTEQYSAYLLESLLHIDTPHRFVLYFNRLPTPVPSWLRGAEVRAIPFSRFWTHGRLSWEMLRRPPDLLFVPAHVLPLIHPHRTVVTVHDLGYLYYPRAHPPLRRLELHLSTLWNVRVATRVIAVSGATRDDLIHRYHVAPERVHVVHHGVSPRFRPTQAPETCARYGLPERYLLYLGTLQPRKNLERLLPAYAQLPPSAPPLVLAGGRGWYFERIARAVRAHKLQERVLFPGYISDADLPAVLSHAVAFVYPSLYEGFGMPLLEAMACGTPVIASRSSSLPEVVGDAGLLVDPLSIEAIRAAMERILEDQALRETLRVRGLERARAFSWERCAQETLAVLEQALAVGDRG